jgi:hypothetical protein
MLTFTVHEAPNPPADRADRAAALAFVRDGFCWTAALFAPFWMLAHGLWWPLLGYVVAGGLIELVRQTGPLDPGWIALAWAALHLLVGFEAHSLRRWTLAERGWTTLGTVSGRTAEDCERRFFDLWLPTQPVIAPPAASAAATSARKSLTDALSGTRN